MKKRLRFSNGFKYGNHPINLNLAQLIQRQREREALAGQVRAFNFIAEKQGW